MLISSAFLDSDYGVGELEITPISAAIARHLGIDLSAEGKAARNRRGIALFVHGAPLSGKTATASSLAEKYNIALLTVDDIVKEAISYGNSPAGDLWHILLQFSLLVLTNFYAYFNRTCLI